MQAIIGQAYVVAALDQLGVHSNHSPLASRMNPLLTMGQAFSGTAPQGTHLYRGKMPRIYGTVFVLLPLLLLIVGIGAVASANYDTASFIGIITIGGLFLSTVSRRRWLAVPAFVITRPDGFAYYIPPIGVYVPLALAFQAMTALRIENLPRTTIIHYTSLGMQHSSSIVLHASTFPNHRIIGAEVLTAYQQFGLTASSAYPPETRVRTPNTPPL